jgi:hypothetical protein
MGPTAGRDRASAVVIGLQGPGTCTAAIRIDGGLTIPRMQRRHWPFDDRPPAGRWPLTVAYRYAPDRRPDPQERTEEDEAERELMLLVAVAMVVIMAAAAAIAYVLI